MKGTGCGAICSAQERARSRAGALQRARHRVGEVAAAGLGGGTWHGEKRYSARWMWVQGSRGDAWGGGEAEGGLRPSQSGGRAALTAGAVEQS